MLVLKMTTNILYLLVDCTVEYRSFIVYIFYRCSTQSSTDPNDGKTKSNTCKIRFKSAYQLCIEMFTIRHMALIKMHRKNNKNDKPFVIDHSFASDT